MSPDDYLVVVYPASRPVPSWLAVPPDLRQTHVGPGLQVWVSSRSPSLRVTAVGRAGVLIGDIFEARPMAGGVSRRFDLSHVSDMSVDQTCDRLMRDGWGRYIFIAHSPQETAAFRDPSGALDCLTWRRDVVRFFAGRLPGDLDPLLPSSISIDWSKVAHQLSDPLAVSGASAVRNITTVAGGALWSAEAGALGHARQLWVPTEVVRTGRQGGNMRPTEALRQTVQTCVATLVEPHQRLLAEISGGLDSAIVATSLTHAMSSGVGPLAMRWVNYATGDLEGDERRFARAVADRLRLELTESFRPELRYTTETLAAVGTDLRVGLAALDPEYDADLVQQAQHQSAQALVTGQGGDAVFLQMASDEVLADRLRLSGRLDLSEMLAHSRRWRTSIWHTFGLTLARAAWPGSRQCLPPTYLVDRAAVRPAPHPWLEHTRGLSAAKAAQIEALVASQNVFGSSQRSRAISCLHPLLSQPVVELSLSIPSFELTRGGADRALARAAFAPWLPQVLLDRRSKGSLQAFYGRAVAASLDVLRPWLLEGLLAREGLLRLDRLEPLLRSDALIMKDVYVDLLHAAAMEAWVRGWAERVAAIKNRSPHVNDPSCHQGS